MIEFADQQALAEKIARSVAHANNPACWQVVLPPGFADEQLFTEQLLAALRGLAPARSIACVHADAVRGRDGYARALAACWKMPLDPEAPDALQTVLGGLTARRPGIQVLTHFHKIVRTLDAQVLGDLRAAEQGPACRLRTVTLTPLPYSELKERWRHEGVAFSVSDYGDTHHDLHPLPMNFEKLRPVLAAREMPQKLIDFALCLTGGYPAPLKALFDRWEAEHRPAPRPEICELLRHTAEQRLDRFAEWLDRAGEARYCGYVCDLYHGLDVENARIHLSLHPWRGMLMGSDGLRAEAAGSCAAMRLAKVAQNSSDEAPRRDVWRRGRELYRLRRFVEVARLIEAAPGLTLRPHLRLLFLHAQIMALLTGGDGSPMDANWGKIVLLLEEAQSVGAKSLDSELLQPRYLELLTPARAVVKAIAAGRRPVDILGGLRGNSASPEAAAFVLTLCLAAGKRITGPSAALKLVFELPEQIFRCWAFLALGANYYSAPADDDEIWNAADAEWTARGIGRSPLQRVAPGEEFASFSAFTFFALAKYRLQKRPLELAPESDFDALDRSLSYFDKRKDFAHAVATANEKDRKNYFALIERWLNAFCIACPGDLTQNDLAARADPLPLIAEDGAVVG